MTVDHSHAARRAMKVSKEIQRILFGLGPDIQGAVLADLVALWVAGHNPALRDEALTCWFDTTRQLIPASEKQILERHGFSSWEDMEKKI